MGSNAHILTVNTAYVDHQVVLLLMYFKHICTLHHYESNCYWYRLWHSISWLLAYSPVASIGISGLFNIKQKWDLTCVSGWRLKRWNDSSPVCATNRSILPSICLTSPCQVAPPRTYRTWRRWYEGSLGMWLMLNRHEQGVGGVHHFAFGSPSCTTQ